MEMQNHITVRDYIDGKFPQDSTLWLSTFNGPLQVTGIRWPETNPWIVCGKANAGFGLSFCVHYGTPLYLSKEAAEKAK